MLTTAGINLWPDVSCAIKPFLKKPFNAEAHTLELNNTSRVGDGQEVVEAVCVCVWESCKCLYVFLSVRGRWVRDTGVCWGLRGEGTGGREAIIMGRTPPTSSSSWAARWHTLNPQWRKQHTHTYAYLNTNIVSHTHMKHTRPGSTPETYLEEVLSEFSFNQPISYNSPALCI